MAHRTAPSNPSFPHLAPVWHHYTDRVAVRAKGCSVYDEKGRRYLDMASGIGVAGTGHCHPRVVEAIAAQARELIFGQVNCVVPKVTLEFARELAEVTPEGIDTFFFANSGAEATEGSVKLARAVTGRPNVIAFQGSFHGRTYLAMALTSSKTVYRRGYQPLPSGVFFAPYPYPSRYGWSEETCVDFCVRELEHLLCAQTAPEETAAILVEPILGEGGYVPAPPRFLRALRRICDEHGILFVVDEIQSGFGRTGCFWAHEHAGVKPDVLVMAKGIASGMPLSAIGAPRALMEKWLPGSHGGTYGGGNAVVMAAARATLQVLREEMLVERARELGTVLTTGLRKLQKRFPIVREVRGLGLMVGVELQKDGMDTKGVAEALVRACARRGLLLLTCGTYGNVVRWIPPLIATRVEIEEALAIFEQALGDALPRRFSRGKAR